MGWRGRCAAPGHHLLPSKHRTRGSCPRADAARREVRGAQVGGRQGDMGPPGGPMVGLGPLPQPCFLSAISTYCVPGPVAFSPGRAPYPLKMSQVEYHPQERKYLPKLACLSAYCIPTLCQGLYLQDTYWDGYPYFSDGESRRRERQYPAQSHPAESGQART